MEPVESFDFLPFSVHDAFLLSVSQATAVVNQLDDDDFELLLRSVDLVVLSQAFSQIAFERILDVPSYVAEYMTGLLVRLDIISADSQNGNRLVLADMRDLPLILLRLNEGRTVWHAAA
jgi:hypothetical protein